MLNPFTIAHEKLDQNNCITINQTRLSQSLHRISLTQIDKDQNMVGIYIYIYIQDKIGYDSTLYNIFPVLAVEQ